jgi:hypothetical protein
MRQLRTNNLLKRIMKEIRRMVPPPVANSPVRAFYRSNDQTSADSMRLILSSFFAELFFSGEQVVPALKVEPEISRVTECLA